MVGDMSAWAGMFKDLFRQIGDGSLTAKHLEAFLGHCNPFVVPTVQMEWQQFYHKYFRQKVEADFSRVVIPKDPGGFDRVVFIPRGLSCKQVIVAMRKKFPAWTYWDNLDQNVTANDRTASRDYAIRLRDRQEADEELKNLSANQLRARGDQVIALLERLVLELKYYDETGQHLDQNNLTLCAGSRDLDGDVPGVRWRPVYGGLRVGWCSPVRADDRLRGRSVVS